MTPDAVLSHLRALADSEDRDAYVRFVESAGDAALRRDGGPEHLTASGFVFSPDLERILLCFHRKGRFWVQFGGHLEEQDPSLPEAALREAREESGVADLTLLSERVADLDRHELNAGFSCAAHWDVSYLAIAPVDADVTVSDESEDVRWFRVDALPDETPPEFPTRLRRVLQVARSLR